jgi:hypothetical protein
MKRYRESFLAAFLQLNSQPRRGVRRFDCVRRARPRINPPKLARFSPKGSGQGCFLLRASNEHRPSNLIDPSKLACVSLGMAPVLVPLRPSSEHILIMRAPGARNQHGCHSIPFLSSCAFCEQEGHLVTLFPSFFSCGSSREHLIVCLARPFSSFLLA